MISLLLVDDHEIVRTGLRMLFESQPDMTILGEASDGKQAVECAQRLLPDVVIIDVAMPVMNGIEATRQIKTNHPDIAVLALTMHEDEQYVRLILEAGASGYIPKRAAPDDLISAVHAVSKGHAFLHSTTIGVLQGETDNNDAAAKAHSAQELLTPREIEVLQLLASGITRRELADALVISVKTVDRHIENIMAKLDIHNRVELARYAIEEGYTDIS